MNKVRCSNCGATPPDGDAAGWALPRSADDETPPLCVACSAAVLPSAEAFALEHEAPLHSCPSCPRTTPNGGVCDDCAAPPDDMN